MNAKDKDLLFSFLALAVILALQMKEQQPAVERIPPDEELLEDLEFLRGE
jgi:hypothetical protein